MRALLRLAGARLQARTRHEWSQLDRLRAALREADASLAHLLQGQSEEAEPLLHEAGRHLAEAIRTSDAYYFDLVDRPRAATSASTPLPPPHHETHGQAERQEGREASTP